MNGQPGGVPIGDTTIEDWLQLIRPALARHGGVAALLSREGPWEPVASGLRVEKRI